MSKAVLISIQPKWCELIASGKKTVEVRKTKPKLSTPFKCYIYCTKAKKFFSIGGGVYAAFDELYRLPTGEIKFGDSFELAADWAEKYDKDNFLNGKVIGEFVCNKIDKITHCGTCNNDIRLNIVDINLYVKKLDYEFLNKCQLSYSDIDEYSNGCDVYAWHLSNLVIYDTPKELSKFHKPCVANPCINRNFCSTGSSFCPTCTIKRPPQSWCYVEELKS